MYKNAATKQSYLSRTGSFGTHGTRAGADLLGLGAAELEAMDPQQQRAALVAASEGVQQMLRDVNEKLRPKLPFKEAHSLKLERAALVARHTEIVDQIKAINPLCQRAAERQEIGDFIIKVMRERLTKPEWAAVLAEATRRFEAQPPIE